MQEVGKLASVWRYPVKGMAGESLQSAPMSPQGLAGDRIWALRDTARAEVQSCKTRPDLLRCQATTGAEGQVQVSLPDGRHFLVDDPELVPALSRLVGRDSSLEYLRPAEDLAFYARYRPDADSWVRELTATFERAADEPLPPFLQGPREQLSPYVGVLGSFFLVTPLHLVTTATLAHLQSLRPESDWDVRRFRANLVIATPEGERGLVEQAWIGRRLHIGSVSIDVVDTTVRCGAITRAQADFNADAGILRTVVREADQNVGIYGSVLNAGVVAVGEPVFLD